jgi:multicomponent Na+:H+ antiporter subunit D
VNNLVALPLVIPLIAAALCVVVPARARPAIGIAGSAGLLAAAVSLLLLVQHQSIATLQIGAWRAPFGITLVIDHLSVLMLLLAATTALTVSVYATVEGPPGRSLGYFHALLHVLLMGVSGAFLTGDLFNLYVWFEVVLIASFALVGMGGSRAAVEGATKALVLNLLGSMLFLIAVGATYGMTGTLNMAELHLRLGELYQTRPNAVTAVGFTLAIAFGLKAALAPLYFWLPASYHVPQAATGALFAAILTKVGIYALIRVFTLPFADLAPLYTVVLALATITMLSGVLGAVTQVEIKRILAWHSISQVGYIAAGVGLLSASSRDVQRAALAAAIFFTVHHGLIKAALFLVAGLIQRTQGTTRLKPLGGLFRAQPRITACFGLAALSLAGIPPLSGFWAKLAAIRSAGFAEQPLVLAVMLVTGLLTLLSMLKIWNEAFWKPPPEPASEVTPSQSQRRNTLTMSLATAALITLATLVGLVPAPLLHLTQRAARQTLSPAAYVEALGLPSSAETTKNTHAPKEAK